MNKLFQNKVFVIGFLTGILIFITLNYLSYVSNNVFICDDCGWSFGFPFNLYIYGSFLHLNDIIWIGLIADVLIAILFSFILGSIFKFAWSKIAPQKLK